MLCQWCFIRQMDHAVETLPLLWIHLHTTPKQQPQIQKTLLLGMHGLPPILKEVLALYFSESFEVLVVGLMKQAPECIVALFRDGDMVP